MFVSTLPVVAWQLLGSRPALKRLVVNAGRTVLPRSCMSHRVCPFIGGTAIPCASIPILEARLVCCILVAPSRRKRERNGKVIRLRVGGTRNPLFNASAVGDL